jgi:hypothetical protein
MHIIDTIIYYNLLSIILSSTFTIILIPYLNNIIFISYLIFIMFGTAYNRKKIAVFFLPQDRHTLRR